MPDSTTRTPQTGELKSLQNHFRYLATRSRQYLGTIPSWLQDEEVVDLEILRLLKGALEALLGADQLQAQIACPEARGHAERGICELCGFSLNLYLGAFEKLLRRSDKAKLVNKRDRRRRGITIGTSRR